MVGAYLVKDLKYVKNILIFYCDINIKNTTYLTFMVINSGGIM